MQHYPAVDISRQSCHHGNGKTDRAVRIITFLYRMLALSHTLAAKDNRNGKPQTNGPTPSSLREALVVWSLRKVGDDTSDLLRAVVGKPVHGLLGKVEPVGPGVHGSHVDGGTLIFEAVALSAVGAVPTGDAEGSADIRVGWKLAGSIVSLGDKAVFAVRAGGVAEIKAW